MKCLYIFGFIFLSILNPATLFASSFLLNPQIEERMAEIASEDSEYGIFIQDLNSGQVLYSKNSDLLLNPASNTKILTSLAALSLWGPDYTFKTEMLGFPGLEASTLNTLTLRGFGDPSFNSERLEAMVRQLKERGILRVDHVFIDGSYFDGEEFPGQMEGRQRDAIFNCNVSALSIDHNLLEIIVYPAEKGGKQASIQTLPPLFSFPIEGEVITQGKRSRILVKNAPKNENDLTVSVKGSIPLKAESESFKISVHHPLQLTGYRLLEALKNQGIQGPLKAEFQGSPLGSLPLVESSSPPLSQILQEMNKNSDNFIAEQLTKMLGAKFVGLPGSSAKGVSVILKRLKEMGIHTEGLVLENGSGLSRMNRVRAQTLAQVLQKAYQDPQIRQHFLATLSVLGVDGTLKKKFRYTDLVGRFLGKTGTLNGVSSLSGYVFPKNTEAQAPLVYSFILNGQGKNFWKEKQVFQDILEMLLND